MSNVKLSFLLLYFSMILSSECPHHLHITQRTDLIYQRFYLIKRLHDPVHVLLHCQMQPELFDHMETTFFNHAEIQLIVNEMKAAHSVKPIQVLWERFNAYQYLFDSLFTDECIRLICSLYIMQKPDPIKFLSSREQHLHFLDTVMDARNQQHEKLSVRIPSHVEVTTDQIAQRYFVLKRLRKAMDFLVDVHIQDRNPFFSDTIRTTSIDYTEDVRDDLNQFSHDRIKECLRSLYQEKNLEPLLLVCSECKQYRYATDDTFLQEMLMSVFLVYKSLLLKNISESTEKMVLTEMNQVLEVYENLDRLSLDEILEAIDVATDTLITIQNIQKESYTKHFWWLPGAALCAVLGMQVLHYLHIV